MWLAEPENMKQILIEKPLELETEDALEHTKRGQASTISRIPLILVNLIILLGGIMLLEAGQTKIWVGVLEVQL
jgi:hypothetical protein